MRRGLTGVLIGLVGVGFGMIASRFVDGTGGVIAMMVPSLLGMTVASPLMQEQPAPPRPFEERVEGLTAALKTAVATIEEIEADVESRRLLAARLEADLTHLRGLASLEDEEAAAVQQLVASQLAAGQRRGFWQGIVTNGIVGAVFFVLGLFW